MRTGVSPSFGLCLSEIVCDHDCKNPLLSSFANFLPIAPFLLRCSISHASPLAFSLCDAFVVSLVRLQLDYGAALAISASALYVFSSVFAFRLLPCVRIGVKQGQ